MCLQRKRPLCDFPPSSFSCRASLAMHRMNLALAYFEKAIGNVIIAKGHGTADLISLYEEVAQIEQLRKNHEQAIQYLQQVGSLARWPCLSPGPVASHNKEIRLVLYFNPNILRGRIGSMLS